MRSVVVVRLAVGVASAAGVLTAGAAAMGDPAFADTGCSRYEALGAATAASTAESWPGVLLVGADANLPAAQAQVGSLSGSTAWAGAPYSATIAENMGLTGMSPNDVPLVAVSSYPTQPQAGSSTPAATFRAKSDERSSSATAQGGGPASETSSMGRATASASSSCAEDGTVAAVADNVTEAVDVQDVLRIGSVRSHARAAVDPAGRRALVGTMDVEGATVLGQSVAITDRGVVPAEPGTPGLGDDLNRALADAGISVRYIAVVHDAEHGQVFAPGLEITVTREVEGAGTGPATTMHTLGRAYARASASVDGAAPDALATLPDSPLPPSPASGSALESAERTGAPSPAVSSVARSPGDHGVQLVTTTIANASNADVYAAAVVGFVLVVAGWFVFEKGVMKLRWR